ncbi:hypothetical protein MN032_17850 [Agromyces atrinae]|uniref:hypothetical protein n=1 Tax=Agromyces atrinae TaxID=592376 RepID=UPI001F56B5B8|nr:hypothetical protein [Agromyces atrinae]MCI2959552.1 hypothetical protein [Agromyces atrinae]
MVRPLPGLAGLQVTETYLHGSLGAMRPDEMMGALLMSVDGAEHDPETGRWQPLPDEQRTNYIRIGMELSQSEAEAILMPAFFWQTVLGIDGVNAYLSGGGGVAGAAKALGALSQRLGRLIPQTSPRTASAALTSAGSTPTTSSRPSTAPSVKLPRDRQPKRPAQPKG